MASDYSYGAIAGTYQYRSDSGTSMLILKKDQIFYQEVNINGKIQRVQGTWRKLGEGRVVFSNQFVRLPEQMVRPDGQADGEIEKRIGLFRSIHLNPDPGGPVFRRQTFR